MTVGDLFKEWITEHAALNLSERYATDAVRWWDREIATRSIARVRLALLADDPALITRFQDDLTVPAGLTTASRVQVLKVLRSVLRWGRRRYPRTLTVEFSGLFSLPSQQRKRLIYAADAVGGRAPDRSGAHAPPGARSGPADPRCRPGRGDGLHRRGSPIRVAPFRHLGRPLRDPRLSSSAPQASVRTEGGLAVRRRARGGAEDGREQQRCCSPTHAIAWARIGRSSKRAMVLSPTMDSSSRCSARTGRLWRADGSPVAWSADDYKRGPPGSGAQRASAPRRRPTPQVGAATVGLLRPQAHRDLDRPALHTRHDPPRNGPAQPRRVGRS